MHIYSHLDVRLLYNLLRYSTVLLELLCYSLQLISIPLLLTAMKSFTVFVQSTIFSLLKKMACHTISLTLLEGMQSVIWFTKINHVYMLTKNPHFSRYFVTITNCLVLLMSQNLPDMCRNSLRIF